MLVGATCASQHEQQEKQRYRKGIREDRFKDGRYARHAVPSSVPTDRPAPLALPGAAFVPYAEAVPDGGRHGFEAAKTVASPHRLAA